MLNCYTLFNLITVTFLFRQKHPKGCLKKPMTHYFRLTVSTTQNVSCKYQPTLLEFLDWSRDGYNLRYRW